MTPSRATVRRGLALLCFLGILAFHVEPQLIRMPFVRRTELRLAFADLPDHGWAEYRMFLEGVREHTAAGDSILIVVPGDWENGYSYAYFRGSYFLAGREVLPLMLIDNRLRAENVHRAKYVAAWKYPVRPGARRAWEGHGGVLLSH